MNRSVTFCLFTAAILTAATGWAENQPAAPAASLVPPAAAPAAAQPPVIAEPAKPVVATLPRKLEVMPPPFGQFASLVRYADANGDMAHQRRVLEQSMCVQQQEQQDRNRN